MQKPERHSRKDYVHFSRAMTKLHDNDIYGHLNNNLYHILLDNAVNRFLTIRGGLSMHDSEVIGVIVNSGCHFMSELRWPDHEELEVGIRVDELGTTSVKYGGAVFAQGDDKASAQGHLIHTWIERTTRTPVPIPEEILSAMRSVMLEPSR